MSHNTILASVAACVLCLATGYCDTHYVSPEGSGEPPYSTPATASARVNTMSTWA